MDNETKERLRLNREAIGPVLERNSTELKSPSSQIRINSESIVVLRIKPLNIIDDIEEIEEKYSNKFGCKVIILESNLDIVEVIDVIDG